MLNVDSLQTGIVIDHIEAGKSMMIYNYLNLGDLECSIAVIKNAKSKKMGKKDIIKIEDNIDANLDMLGFIDPNATVNIVENGKIIEKKQLNLPERVTNIVKCKNPRCITSIEQELPHIFVLADEAREVYRCKYCEEKYMERG